MMVNIETTSRCTLKCPACIRQNYYGVRNQPVPGKDISIEDFEKITDHFDTICFCGNVSDPITHPRFYDLLKICIRKNLSTVITTAASHRPISWYKKHFLLTKGTKVRWEFSVDGLPKDSAKYRINQDGEKLYDVMRIGSKMGCDILWKYIIFNYNENDTMEAKKLASDIRVPITFIKSVRWEGEMINYQPTDKDNFYTRNFLSDYGYDET